MMKKNKKKGIGGLGSRGGVSGLLLWGGKRRGICLCLGFVPASTRAMKYPTTTSLWLWVIYIYIYVYSIFLFFFFPRSVQVDGCELPRGQVSHQTRRRHQRGVLVWKVEKGFHFYLSSAGYGYASCACCVHVSSGHKHGC